MRRSHRPRLLPILGAVGFALAIMPSSSAVAQETPRDTTSVARYIPKDGGLFYVEYRGLDSQAGAWKKSAAYKILNDTPAGAMIEDVAIQVLEKVVEKTKANPHQWALNAVTILKHLARSGFGWAVFPTPNNPNKGIAVLIFKDAYKDKTIRPLMAGYFQGFNAPNTKPQSVVRLGHKVITGTGQNGKPYTWWVDDSKKEDIILFFDKPEEADVILETLDGKRASVLDHPKRAELLKSDGKFLPTGLAFLSTGFTIAEAGESGKRFEKDYGYLGLGNISSIDVRWGFQDDALMTVARVATSGPRKGLLALLFDPSSLDKSKLPPIPSGLTGFTAASIDLAGELDRLRGQLKLLSPDVADAMIDKLIANVKDKTKLRLKEDLLAHLGPRVAWFTLPKPAAKGPAGLAGMLGAGLEIPRFALVCDVDDASAFGKALDQAMIAVNRELKSVGKPPGEAPAKGGACEGRERPSLEFKPLPPPGKGYVLNVPQELAGSLPPTVRPVIRVGPKQVVIAVSAEVARLVLDSKANWTPPSELATAHQALPANLKALSVSDPRETLPDLLAAFPARVQQVASMAAVIRPPTPPGVVAPPPQPPGGQPPLVLKVDAAKLPSADSIKALLYPSLFTVEATDEEVRFVSRDAFPTIPDPAAVAVQAALILPAIQAARDRSRNPAPGATPRPATPPAATKPGRPTVGTSAP